MIHDIAIVGGGIVGLATGLGLLAQDPGLRVCLLEKEPEVGAHQTGHNSGVIHSGLYYRPGSLKARLSVEGARRMIEFCREHGLPHEVCGKLVVATSAEELPALAELLRRGTENGVPGLEEVGPERIREIEPHAAGLRALWVPGTGIADYRAVALKMADLLRSAGVELLLGRQVLGLRQDGPAETRIETSGGEVWARVVVGCAGLHADRVARLDGAALEERIVPFRGEYYTLAPERRSLVRGLIYPVPDPRLPFLGVHFTRRVDGSVEAGPNAVLALRREGYRKGSFSLRDTLETLSYPGFWRLARRFLSTGAAEAYRSWNKAAFTRALQRLLPGLRPEDLSPGGSGVRAQLLHRDGRLEDDFCIRQAGRSVHVLCAPSPAATASLVIGEAIAERARAALAG
jgi:(S)-2-hydroxyglutarate dehydrogenase